MCIGVVHRSCGEDGKWDDEFVECFREATKLFDQVATYVYVESYFSYPYKT